MRGSAMKKATGKKPREPSRAALREMPEVNFDKGKVRRNPYALRIAAEGISIHAGRGRPRKGTETGPTVPRSVRFPATVWKHLERRAKAEGMPLHAALPAAVLAGINERQHVRGRDPDSPASSRAISTNARSAGDTADEKRNRLILDDVVQALQQGRRLRRVRSRSPPGSRCSTRNLAVPCDTTVLGVQITVERVDLDRSEQIVSASLTATPETHASRSSGGVPRPAQDRSFGQRRARVPGPGKRPLTACALPHAPCRERPLRGT